MIQRIQSLYLALGAVALLLPVFLGAGIPGTDAADMAWLTPAVWGLSGLLAVFAVALIFLYKNRERQRSLISGLQWGTLLLVIGLLALNVMSGTLANVLLFPEPVVYFVLPLLAYVFFYLARRGVQRDIHKVKSMDRLR